MSPEDTALMEALDPGRRVESAEQRERVSEVVGTLSEREAEVIELRYGLDGGGPLTLEQCGEMLHVSREMVRQVQRGALERLQIPKRARRLESFCEPEK